MAVKVAHDLGLFDILTKSNNVFSSKELADKSSATPLLIGSFLIVTIFF
jgi:hypothetical protein